MTITVYAKGLTVAVFDNATVPDTTAPTVSIASPVAGTVSGTLDIVATANDNVGVARVDFFINGAKVGSAAAAPFKYSWNTTATANGAASLVATAFDAAGNSAQSAPVAVTVSNAVPSNPLSSLLPGRVRDLGGYADASVTFGENITDYSGVAIDVANNRLLWGPAGGHGSSWANHVRAYNLASQTVTTPYAGTPQAMHTAANADSVLGRWKSDNNAMERHTYNMTLVANGALYVMQGQGMPHPFNADPNDTSLWGGRVCWKTFSDGVWHYSQIASAPWYQAAAAMFDAQMQRIVVAGTDKDASTWGFVWLYDPATDSAVKIYDSVSTQIFGPTNALAYALNQDAYFIINPISGEVWKLTLNRATPTQSQVVKLAVTGKPNYGALGSPYPFSYGYHAPSGKIIGTVVAGKLNTFDPVTKAWSSVQLLNEDGSNANVTQAFYAGAVDPTSACYLFLSTPSAGAGGNPPGSARIFAARP